MNCSEGDREAAALLLEPCLCLKVLNGLKLRIIHIPRKHVWGEHILAPSRAT